MDELDAVQKRFLLGDFQSIHQLHGVQSEFGMFPPGGGPAPGAGADQLDPEPDVGLHSHFLGDADDEVQFVQFLDDHKDFFPQFLAHQGEPDEGLILVPVADEEGVGVVHNRQDGVQLRLGTGFQTDVVGTAELDYFLHHLALLVDLDGIDAEVVALVSVFLHGVVEGVGQVGDAGTQDIGKADQKGHGIALRLNVFDEKLEVDVVGAVGVGLDNEVSPVVDVEITRTPTVNVVMFLGFFNRPLLHDHPPKSRWAKIGPSNFEWEKVRLAWLDQGRFASRPEHRIRFNPSTLSNSFQMSNKTSDANGIF